jgi:uncharacterized protein (DUF58 family)
VAEAVVRSSAVWADRRLGTYAVLASVGTVLALVSGRGAYLAAAAPAAVLLAFSARHGRAPGVEVTVREPPERILEGDRWDLELALRWRGRATVDLELRVGGGLRPHGPARVRVEGVDGGRVCIPLDAVRWGRHGLGRMAVRARRPHGVLVHDLELELPGVVRVLPAAARLDALLHPARPRAASGPHRSPARGVGTDFAELRPYVPGDRLRDVSWAASARSDEPWVVVHHPERTGTVVLLLDGFTEVGVPAAALDRAARVVWSVARHHLSAGDRVGLVAAGPVPRWLPPAAGRRARWLVLDALLRVAPAASARRRGGARGRVDDAVPPDAVVVGVSALQSDAFLADLVHHRRRGHHTVVVGVALDDLLAPPPDPVEAAARRLWHLDTEARIAHLAQVGIRTVAVSDDVGPAVRRLAATSGVPA